MLPASARVRTRADHQLVASRGRRVGAGPLVLHALDSGSGRPRAGVVVGRRVGPAVTRNVVKRRLRELLRDRLPSLADGTLVVVRARPTAAAAGWAELGSALDSGLARLGRPDRRAAAEPDPRPGRSSQAGRIRQRATSRKAAEVNGA